MASVGIVCRYRRYFWMIVEEKNIMPPKNEFKIEDGTVYINGVDLAYNDIPELDMSDVQDYWRDHKTIIKTDAGELILHCDIPYILMLKLVGIWDYAYTYCPSRRVRHLMVYGKNDRVKIKNYRHAMNLINKYLLRGRLLKDNLHLIK